MRAAYQDVWRLQGAGDGESGGEVDDSNSVDVVGDVQIEEVGEEDGLGK
jgi:hypothetical protein